MKADDEGRRQPTVPTSGERSDLRH
ncbi:MAG: hypothetical protein K0R28_3491, partial [Paenibacillus sp.]|nr:hypothetical protein [Paenibacillus sp.]